MAKEALLNYIEGSTTNITGLADDVKSRLKTFFETGTADVTPDIIKQKVGSRLIFAGDGHIYTHGKDLLEKFAILANRKTLLLKYDDAHQLTYDPFGSESSYSVDLGEWLSSLTTSAMHYKGLTNSKTAPAGAKAGDFYKVSGVTDNTIFGINGSSGTDKFDWSIGDSVVFNGTTWDRIPSGDSKWIASNSANLSWTAATPLGAIDGVSISIPVLPSITQVVSAAIGTDVTSTTNGKYTIGTITIGPTGNQTTTTFLGKDTTYTFTSGTAGSFTITPVGGTAQTVSIGKPATAGTADKVSHALSFGEGLSAGWETIEGTSTKLTYDGSVARSLSIVQATSSTLGGIKTGGSGSNLTLDQYGALSLTQANVLSALGTTLDALTNTWRPIKVNHTSAADGNKSAANNHTPDNLALDFISTESGIMAQSMTTTNSDEDSTLHIGFSLAWYNISTGQYELPSTSYTYNSSTASMEKQQ